MNHYSIRIFSYSLVQIVSCLALFVIIGQVVGGYSAYLLPIIALVVLSIFLYEESYRQGYKLRLALSVPARHTKYVLTGYGTSSTGISRYQSRIVTAGWRISIVPPDEFDIERSWSIKLGQLFGSDTYLFEGESVQQLNTKIVSVITMNDERLLNFVDYIVSNRIPVNADGIVDADQFKAVFKKGVLDEYKRISRLTTVSDFLRSYANQAGVYIRFCSV